MRNEEEELKKKKRRREEEEWRAETWWQLEIDGFVGFFFSFLKSKSDISINVHFG